MFTIGKYIHETSEIEFFLTEFEFHSEDFTRDAAVTHDICKKYEKPTRSLSANYFV